MTEIGRLFGNNVGNRVKGQVGCPHSCGDSRQVQRAVCAAAQRHVNGESVDEMLPLS